MDLTGQQLCPFPDDPTLAEAAVALRDAGYWADIVDRDWRWVYSTDDLRLASGFMLELVPIPLGAQYFGADALSARLLWRTGPVQLTAMRCSLAEVGPWVLADTPGGRERLRERIDPRLHEAIEKLSDAD